MTPASSDASIIQCGGIKTDFKDGHHLGFTIWTILVIFDLPVTPMILPSFKSIDLSVQEKKRKTDFQDAPWQPYWISDQKDFSYF